MTRIGRFIAPAIAVLALANASAQEKSLYLRLGGYDQIAAIVDDFGGRIGTNEQFKRFFGGHSKETQMRQRQLFLDLLCQMTGGPCIYIGRDLKAAHGGLGITKADWDAASKIFIETLAKFNIGEREQHELGALIGPREKDIVEK